MARRPTPHFGPGDTALVTGASAGLGAAFARRLAARGCDLVIVARDRARLEALAAELTGATGRRVDVLAADLTDPAQREVVEQRLAAPGDAPPIDLLVNNAGFAHTGQFADNPVDGEEQVIALNVVALARLAHAALDGMLARGRGGIINVSSVAGWAPIGGVATYAATKAFATSLSQSLSIECRGTGVVVQALCPGYTHTEFQQRSGYTASKVPEFLWMEAEPVVDASLTALDRGRTVCVPGPFNRVGATLARMSPLPLVTRVATLIGRGP